MPVALRFPPEARAELDLAVPSDTKLPDWPLISKEISGLEDQAAWYSCQIGCDPYQFKTGEQGFHGLGLVHSDFQQGMTAGLENAGQ